MCLKNYTLHEHNPPLLYDLHSDPSEIYNLNTTEYSTLLVQIEKVSGVVNGGQQVSQWSMVVTNKVASV